MNDIELDRLLDSWEAPAPAQSLRDGLKARFPRAERPGFVPLLRWALATLVVTVALAVGMAQSRDITWTDLPVVRLVHQLHKSFNDWRESRLPKTIQTTIRESNPMVYVDGQLAAPLDYGPAATIVVQVPGAGVYSVISSRLIAGRAADGSPTGWVEAGRIHDNVIEFRVDARQVRIECDQSIVDGDRPVFVRRLK